MCYLLFLCSILLKNTYFPDFVVSVYKAESFILGCVDLRGQRCPRDRGPFGVGWCWVLAQLTSLSSLS